MKCPFCGHTAIQVIDTRMPEEDDIVRRRRCCESCGRHSTTYERIKLLFSAIVRKNGSHVDYDRNKVKDSMRLALHGRPVSVEAVDEAIARIKEKLFSHGEKEINSNCVGELVICELKRLDRTGYIRFTSAYRGLKDLAEFRDMLGEAMATSARR